MSVVPPHISATEERLIERVEQLESEIKLYAELIQEAIAAERERQWLPIESAPENRKLIVGYFNPLGNWRSVMGCYFTEGELESDTDDSGFAPEGWYEDTQAYEYLMPLEQEPTHWMPIPDAPAICSQGSTQEVEDKNKNSG